MAGCIDCGCPTPNRVCRQCSIERRAEERFRNHDWNEASDDDPDWEITQQGLDGEGAEGQATLDGTIQKPGGDER
jgi:hypothetical protein